MKNTIVIHRDWLIPTDEMSDAEYREYLDAIFAYAFEGKRPEDRSLRMLLRLVFQHIDNYEAKYDKSIQQRKEAVRKRWERYRKEHGLDAPTADTTVCDTIRDNTGDTVTVTDTVTGTGTDTGVPVELGTENKEKTPNGVKKKVAAATAAPRRATAGGQGETLRSPLCRGGQGVLRGEGQRRQRGGVRGLLREQGMESGQQSYERLASSRQNMGETRRTWRKENRQPDQQRYPRRWRVDRRAGQSPLRKRKARPDERTSPTWG